MMNSLTVGRVLLDERILPGVLPCAVGPLCVFSGNLEDGSCCKSGFVASPLPMWVWLTAGGLGLCQAQCCKACAAAHFPGGHHTRLGFMQPISCTGVLWLLRGQSLLSTEQARAVRLVLSCLDGLALTAGVVRPEQPVLG